MRLHRLLAAGFTASATIGLLASPVSASPGQTSTFDPTGATFTCTNADQSTTVYTVTGGLIHQIMHDSFSANGAEHVTGTVSPTGVTLTDGTGTVYRLAGATWFGGNFNPATGHFEFTDTGFFNILAPSGGVVGKVATVEHDSSNGASFSFDFGNCIPPQD